MQQILIFMDKREDSRIGDFFYQYNCRIEKKVLPVGDFLLSDRVVVERKTTKDFVQSLTDGRLFQQIKAMKESFERPILIVEGQTLYGGNVHPNAIRGALAAITIDAKVPILWTQDMADTAGLIHWIAKREQDDDKREIPLRGKKKRLTSKEKQEFLVHGLPDVSIVRARALLEHFKSPVKIFSATERDLLKVKGVGKGVAKKIRNIMTKKYG